MDENGKKKQDLMGVWIEKIQTEGLPAFSESIQWLSQLADEEEVELQKLSKFIKKDPGLSTKIIQASSSVHRIRRGRINTVSRALVMLGVEEVKKICLTCALVDGLTEGDPPQELIDEMTTAFYCATQARLFSLVRGDPHSEEVFLSGMMLSVGPVAMWRVAEEEMKQVAAMVEEDQCPLEIAEQKVFGFTLADFSRALAEAWNLGQYIPSPEDESKVSQKRLREISVSSELGRALTFGWESLVVANALERVHHDLAMHSDAALSVLKDASREMVEMARSFGIEPPIEPLEEVEESAEEESSGEQSTEIRTIEEGEVEVQSTYEKQISQATKKKQETKEKDLDLAVLAHSEEAEYTPQERDIQYQLEALGKLSSVIASGGEPGEYVPLIIDGIHKGVGLDRVVFALLNKSQTKINGRFAFGPGREHLLSTFSFTFDPGVRTIFQFAFQREDPVWLKLVPASERNAMGTELVTTKTGASDFLLSPILVNGKWVGVFYADMKPSGRELTKEIFQGFSQFGAQATLAFQHFELSQQAKP